MQFMVYRNNSNNRAYPYLLDVQSDIIDELNTRLVIPLFLLDEVNGRPARRLTPVLNVDGEDFLVMTHEMASVRQSQLGEEVVSVQEHRQAIKNALDVTFPSRDRVPGCVRGQMSAFSVVPVSAPAPCPVWLPARQAADGFG